METKNKIRIVLLIVVWALVWLLGACSSDKYLTERTVAQTQARIAEADSAAQVSRNQAETERFATLAAAAKPDNMPLYLLIAGVISLAGMVIYFLLQTNLIHAQTTQATIMAQLPQQAYIALPEPPRHVLIAARHWRGEPVFDGACWEIVDSRGNVLASERKQLKG